MQPARVTDRVLCSGRQARVRLKQIRLSGFKSFVDPTVLEVPGRLVGIVGPNGCGKSNLMDAVRWVLGESRAHELRGESMQDVIFTGSAERKPAGRASVELVFDNALGRIGGSWSAFTEVAVRRVLTRDGQSTYSINQQVVRRRDVHDLFLGTGLGPRAYAIIGQGTISRIIESRPEELRVFLEEAAGVSRYKERRRETEHRLAATRENLTRVEDILRELQESIGRLEAQAAKARRHTELHTARALRQGLLWLSRRDEARDRQQRLARRRADTQLNLEESLAKLRAAEATLEGLRSAVQAANDALHRAQGEYYQTGSEASRHEAELRHLAAARERASQQLASVQAQQALHRSELGEQEARCLDSRQRLDALGSSILDQQARVAHWLSQGDLHREAVRGAQHQVDDARNALERARTADEAARIRALHAQQQLRQLEARGARAQAALAALRAPEAELLAASIQALQHAEAEERQCAAQERECATRAADASTRASALQDGLRRAQQLQAETEARLAALQQLEARIDAQSQLAPWLRAKGWEDLPRLWSRLRIEPGWDSAFEAVLRERVESIELASFAELGALSADPSPLPGKQAFFHRTPMDSPAQYRTLAGQAEALPAGLPSGTAEQGEAQAPEGCAGLWRLAHRVHCQDAQLAALLEQWLGSCYAIQDLRAALLRQSQLGPGVRLVTPQGHLIERNAVLLFAADQVQEGRLARRREIEQLEREARAQRMMAKQALQQADHAEGERREADALREQMRKAHLQAARLTADRRIEEERLRQRAARAEAEGVRLQHERDEVAQDSDRVRKILPDEGSLRALAQQVVQDEQRLGGCRAAFLDAQDAVARWRESSREAERELDAYKADARILGERLEASTARCAALEGAIQSLAQQGAELEALLATLRDDAVRHALQRALEARMAAEQRLGDRRQQAEALGVQCRESDEHRQSIERGLQPLRDAIAAASLEEQAAQLSAEQLEALLAEARHDAAALREEAGAQGITMQPSSLQAALHELAQEIAALGPVNLAALEELQAARTREGFLQSQSADLREAMAVLEDAIRRIDRETRALLRDTYDQVNLNFGHFFPRLFGGGEARLLLSGEEILDAGVQVIAQPPGKRNSSIQVLSGGEKALTAIALVFAIFQLNPAPFCLLDEVDAPLDDANTERYCDIVRTMAEQTQFLFITHNKVAMELAEQLVGVTMQEKGVSRLVAVDLDMAARYAEAA